MMIEDNRPIMVTIRCAAYNHEPFIRQCLDGFVMQQTNFRFEAIVHDDASTDGTADIIREYAEKYPDVIKPIYETENQYSKRDGSLGRIMDAHTRGKYVAMCEGDDYWTDPLKLKKQVDFLESHPGYVVCVHRYKMYFQDSKIMDDEIYPLEVPPSGIFDLSYYVGGHEWFTQPLTTLYRKDALNADYSKGMKYYKDVAFFYFLLKNGKGYLMSDCSGVYRIHLGGVFSCIPHAQKIFNELLTIEEICRFDYNKYSVNLLLLNIKDNLQCVGLRLMWKQRKLLCSAFCLIAKMYGMRFALKLFVQSLHIKSSLMKLLSITKG